MDAPVPLAHEKGVFDRALKFLLKLQHGARCGGSMDADGQPAAGHRARDLSEVGADEDDDQPRRTWARSSTCGWNCSRCIACPVPNAIAFDIRCYLCSFDQIRHGCRKWARRFAPGPA